MQQHQQQHQHQLTNFKTSQPPRVLEYTPHYGPEGQPFTVTLQASAEKALRIGFGTLVVDTKQYAANGYVTLTCTVPNFAITKWFVSKVPLYVLQMENDMVMESWPFGDYSYYEDTQSNGLNNNNANNSNTVIGTKRPSNEGNSSGNKMSLYGQSLHPTPLSNKKQHLVTDLDLSHAALASHHQHHSQQQVSPLPSATPTSLHDLPRRK
jgi:hypothetical protein